MPTYYANDDTGSPSNPGTELAPWTLAHALTQLAPGDTLIVKARENDQPYTAPQPVGWYSGWQPTTSGVAGAPIVIEGAPTRGPIVSRLLDAQTITSGGSTWGFLSRDYITIRGFRSTGRIGASYCSNIIIEGCEVTEGSPHTSDLTLNHGIRFEATKDCIIRHNYVHDIIDNGRRQENQAGILILSHGLGVDQASNCLVEYNEVDARTVENAYGHKGDWNLGHVWRFNISRTNARGMHVMGASEGSKPCRLVEVYQNLFIGPVGTALTNNWGGIDITHGVRECSFYNNTIYGFFNAINVSPPVAMPNPPENGGTIENDKYDNLDNLFWNNIGGGPPHATANFPTTPQQAFGIGYPRTAVQWDRIFALCDWNCVYSPFHVGWRDNGTTYANRWSLATWQANTLQGDHDLHTDPLFVDPASEDFHLQAGSPCRGTGRGGAFASTMGAYITGDEAMGPNWRPLGLGGAPGPAAPRIGWRGRRLVAGVRRR